MDDLREEFEQLRKEEDSKYEEMLKEVDDLREIIKKKQVETLKQSQRISLLGKLSEFFTNKALGNK